MLMRIRADSSDALLSPSNKWGKRRLVSANIPALALSIAAATYVHIRQDWVRLSCAARDSSAAPALW